MSAPDGSAGLIPLSITLFNRRDDRVTVAVAVSLDQGGTWKPARLRLSPSDPASDAAIARDLPASADGASSIITWDSIPDIGFHTARSAWLLLTPSDADGDGAAYRYETPVIDNLRAAARRVDHFMSNYGSWDATSIAMAKRHQLVILRPDRANLGRAQIADIQAGVDAADPADDVLVLGYVSAGEDLRTAALSDDQVRGDPRFTGSGSGPASIPAGRRRPASAWRGSRRWAHRRMAGAALRRTIWTTTPCTTARPTPATDFPIAITCSARCSSTRAIQNGSTPSTR